MRWERPFLVGAALYNGAWMIVLLAAPERVFVRLPPFEPLFAALVGLVGVGFAVQAVRPSPTLLTVLLLAKVLGPAVFVAAVLLGYLTPASWPLTLANDVLWLPPLFVLWQRRRPC